MPEISEEGVMFVPDPINVLKSLCKMKNQSMNRHSFIEVYKKVAKKKEVGKKTPDTHFGMLTVFNLVEEDPIDKNQYRISKKGLEICKIMKGKTDLEHDEEFRIAFRNLFMTHPIKKRIFERFLKYIERSKSEEDIRDKFKWGAALTLISWCILAGLAKKEGNQIVKLRHKILDKEISLDDFWKEVKKSYEEHRKKDYGEKRIYIDFEDLRFSVSANLHFFDHKKFDMMFRKLMKSSYKSMINLHGAPTGEYDKKANFLYKGQLYPYLSLVRK